MLVTHPGVRFSVIEMNEAGNSVLDLFQVVKIAGLVRVPDSGEVLEHARVSLPCISGCLTLTGAVQSPRFRLMKPSVLLAWLIILDNASSM